MKHMSERNLKEMNEIIIMKRENLPIQSGSNDPASDSEYLLPEMNVREEKLSVYNYVELF